MSQTFVIELESPVRRDEVRRLVLTVGDGPGAMRKQFEGLATEGLAK